MNEGKVVSFRKRGGISDKQIADLLEKGRKYALDAVVPIPTDKIVVAEWVNLKCRYGCSQYNRSWCCPPATPRPEKARAIIGEYSTALILIGTQTCPEFYRNTESKRINQVRYWKGAIVLERMLFLEGYYKAFGLVGECCALCKDCAFPDECRFPQEKRPTVESFSIDVIGTMQGIGIAPRVARHRMESFSHYGIILLE